MSQHVYLPLEPKHCDAIHFRKHCKLKIKQIQVPEVLVRDEEQFFAGSFSSNLVISEDLFRPERQLFCCTQLLLCGCKE